MNFERALSFSSDYEGENIDFTSEEGEADDLNFIEEAPQNGLGFLQQYAFSNQYNDLPFQKQTQPTTPVILIPGALGVYEKETALRRAKQSQTNNVRTYSDICQVARLAIGSAGDVRDLRRQSSLMTADSVEEESPIQSKRKRVQPLSEQQKLQLVARIRTEIQKCGANELVEQIFKEEEQIQFSALQEVDTQAQLVAMETIISKLNEPETNLNLRTTSLQPRKAKQSAAARPEEAKNFDSDIINFLANNLSEKTPNQQLMELFDFEEPKPKLFERDPQTQLVCRLRKTKPQQEILEFCYKHRHRLAKRHRAEIGSKLGLSETQIYKWIWEREQKEYRQGNYTPL